MNAQTRPTAAGDPRYAYIVHAFKNAEQLTRLVRALATPEVAFYLHIDAKVDIKPFQLAMAHAAIDNVTFVRRENSRWGSIGCVKAVLNGMAEVEKRESIEYAHLLSGQDYPIKSNAEIAAFFAKNKDLTYMWSVPLPYANWSGNGGLDRLTEYHVQPFKSRALCQGLNRAIGLAHPLLPRRRQPVDLKPYGGSFYFSLSRYALRYVLEFVNSWPEYLKFHKWTLIPEEIFFQMILLNSADPRIRDNIRNESLTYSDWPAVGPVPAVLTESHLPVLENSHCLFARKFDMAKGSSVLDVLDKMNGLPVVG
jgi:hypothetical protein